MDFGALLHYAKKKNDAATKDEVRIEQGFTDGVYKSFKCISIFWMHLQCLLLPAACKSLCGILQLPHFHIETMCARVCVYVWGGEEYVYVMLSTSTGSSNDPKNKTRKKIRP